MSAGRKWRRSTAKSTRRTVVVVPDIPDGAPSSVKNGLAIRNRATATGRCPACGARMEVSAPVVPGQVTDARMLHESWCPALVDTPDPNGGHP